MVALVLSHWLAVKVGARGLYEGQQLVPGLTDGSTLPKAIANLVALICDIDAMEQELRDLDIDPDRMPLGRISRKGLTAAFSVLQDLQVELMQPRRAHSVCCGGVGVDVSGGPRNLILADLTNRFYTMVPHSIPPGVPLPVLDNEHIIDQKVSAGGVSGLLGAVGSRLSWFRASWTWSSLTALSPPRV